MISNNLKLNSILTMMFMLGFKLYAQVNVSDGKHNQFQFLSPLDMDTVLNNQLLIVVILPLNHSEKYSELKVLLDDTYDFTELIKIKGNTLTVLHDQNLKPGLHTISIYGRQRGERDYRVLANQYFRVIGMIKENKLLRKNKLARTAEKEKVFKLKGSVQLLSNDVWLNGPGAANRQEPVFTREANINLNIKWYKFEIPIQGLITTNARGQFTYRNRLMLGFKLNRFSVYLGDRFVDEDRLILSGIRIQGLTVSVPIGKESTLTVIKGKNVDELLENNNLPLLPNLSTVLFEGSLPRYRRNYLFFKLSSSFNKEINQASFSVLKAYDLYDEPLIIGLKPKDNIVFGFDDYFSFFKKRASFRINFAASLLTNNRAIPTAVPTYEKIININSSTSPLSMNKFESLSLVLNYQFKISKYVVVSLDGKRLGGSYYSLGNPYLLNNRIILRASEKTSIISNKLFLNFSYDYLKDNQNKAASITRENHSVSGNLSLNISQKLPFITLGYRTFLSNMYGSNTLSNAKITSNNIFGSINYILKLKYFTPQISVSRNDMNLVSELSTDTRQQVNDATVSLTYKKNIGIDFQGIAIKQQVGDINLPQQTLSMRIWFKLNKPALRLSFRINQNTINQQDIGVETRNTLQGGIEYTPIKAIMLSINGGSSPYTSAFPANNYDEKFLQIRLGVYF